MSSKKRKEYSPGESYPVYNHEFNRLRMASQILNEEQHVTAHSIFLDRPTIESLLRSIKGDDNGYYQKANYSKNRAFLPQLNDKLFDLQDRFDQINLDRINHGFLAFVKLPDDLQEQKYKLDAKVDITLEEIEFLELKLKVFTDKVQKRDDSAVLQRGLTCCSRNWGSLTKDPDLMNVMKEIDGQDVAMHPKGFLIIDDSRSPYDGMSLPDYRRLAKQFHADRRKADEDLLKRMQQEAKDNNDPKPFTTGRNLLCNISKSSLPAWPKWAKNWKETESEQEENLIKAVKRIRRIQV